MVWQPRDAVWQEGLAAARAHHQQHGHLRVGKADRFVDGFDLYKWLERRRRERRTEKLPPERVRALDELGIRWSAKEGS